MELKRGIGKRDLLLMVMNNIIGAGIFGLPSKIYQSSGIYSLLALFICAFLIMSFVVCFSEVGSRFEKTGGPYLYTLAALGSKPAFVVGWLLFLARLIGYAALSNLFVTSLSYFHPSFADPLMRGLTISITTLTIVWFNYVGVRNATLVNNVLMLAKLIPLFLFVAIGLFYLQPELFQVQSDLKAEEISNSIIILIFAFGGFEAVTILSEEIKEPRKTLANALIKAIVFIAIFYFLIQIVAIGSFPELASSDKPLADAASVFMGKRGAILISIGAIISIFGTLNANFLNGSRLPYVFSTEKQFPPFFSFIHPTYQTPTTSIIIYGVAGAAIAISGSFIYAVTISSLIRILIYSLVCFYLLKFRQMPDAPKAGFTARWGKLIAYIGILLSIYLLTTVDLLQLRDTLIAIAAGGIIYALNFYTRKGGNK